MEFKAKHTIETMKRIFASQDPDEQIVLIAGADLQRIPIHRVVLNAWSQYFAEQYGPNSHIPKAKECLLVDADAETVTSVVNYCYSGNLQLTDANVEKVYKIVSFLQIDPLKLKCYEFLTDKLSAENAVTTLAMARKNNFNDLGEKAFELICNDPKLISSIDINPLSLWLFKEMLQSDIIETKSAIITRVIEWYESDEGARRQYMPELLNAMNMEHLRIKFIRDTLEPMFRKFDLTESLSAEYEQRAKGLTNYLYIIRAEKLFKFNASKNSFMELRSITFHQPSMRVVHGKKFYEFDEGTVHKKRMARAIDLETHEIQNLPATSDARYRYVVISHGKFIYSFGRHIKPEGGMDSMNSCERLNTETNEWEFLKWFPHHQKTDLFCSAAILNECIFISVMSYPSHRVEFYNSTTCDWTETPPIDDSCVTLVTLKGFLYAVGSRWVNQYNPIDNTWTKVCPWKQVKILSATSVGDKVYTASGMCQFGCIDIDESNNWTFKCLRKFDHPIKLQPFICWDVE